MCCGIGRSYRARRTERLSCGERLLATMQGGTAGGGGDLVRVDGQLMAKVVSPGKVEKGDKDRVCGVKDNLGCLWMRENTPSLQGQLRHYW